MRCRHSIRWPAPPSRRACARGALVGRAKLCHHLTQWLCHQGWSAAVAYLLAKVLLILVTTLSH